MAKFETFSYSRKNSWSSDICCVLCLWQNLWRINAKKQGITKKFKEKPGKLGLAKKNRKN